MTIQAINDAFAKAERLESKLDPECFEIGGFTSPMIRHLMSNLGAISSRYLEIGILRGALSVAATYKNNLKSVVLIDNWSEFKEQDCREDFTLNAYHKFLNRQYPSNLTVLEQDCFKVSNNPEEWGDKFDLYTYDADHSMEAQARALTHFAPIMADRFIFCVDDTNWYPVQKGTEEGIQKAGLTVVEKWHRTGGDWWNGFDVYLLEK